MTNTVGDHTPEGQLSFFVIDKNRMKKTEMNQSASDNVFIQEFDQIFGSAGYIRYYFILEIP